MNFVGQNKYPETVKLVLPLFHDINNLYKKFGGNLETLNIHLNLYAIIIK
jgi:hypothetical protein